MMSKLQLDGILKHRRSVTDLNKKASVEEHEKPPEKLLRPQRSVDAVQEKSKSPTPKRESPVTSAEEPNQVEEVEIPCEFCEVLIPFSRLLIHQVIIKSLGRVVPILNALSCPCRPVAVQT
jgi:hypothetical protein